MIQTYKDDFTRSLTLNFFLFHVRFAYVLTQADMPTFVLKRNSASIEIGLFGRLFGIEFTHKYTEQ